MPKGRPSRRLDSGHRQAELPARRGLTRPLFALQVEPLERRLLLASDFGDAPAPYPTLLSENGAEHGDTGPMLGTSRDTETDGTHSVGADADGADEDGVTIGALYVGQLGASVMVEVVGDDGRLDAWIDFNRDGSWNGPGELIIDNAFVPDGTHSFDFEVPGWALPGVTYARFRVSTLGDLGPGGFTPDGEVEDYAVLIDPPLESPGFLPAENLVTGATDTAYKAFPVDLDLDGDLDVLSASFDDNKIAWYENDGSQNYTEHIISSTAYGARSVVAADISGDGFLDVLAASYLDDSITWYENDGSMNFTPHNISSTAVGASDVLAADVNGDGYVDVVSSSYLGDEIVWYENDGLNNFTPYPVTNTAYGAESVAAADVDGDGDLDLLSAALQYGRVDWYENDGAQNFTPHTISSTSAGAYSVVAVDLDGDGDMDVLVAAYFDDTIVWFENDGNENFTPHTISSTSDGAISVFAADIDGDGDMDVVAASFFDETVAWFENDGSENFTPHVIADTLSGAINVSAADADGDGDLDVFAAAFFDDRVVWYENAPSSIGGRQLFYNRSSFDGNNADINTSDDAAIAIDKSAYLPGDGLAVFENVSSYSRGINGIMIDLVGGGDHAAISLSTLANDFVFKVGNNNTPSSWAAAPTPNAVSVRTNFDGSGTDRVEITWTDGDIKNQWLEVQVLATSRTGLTSTDVFFWGNKIGDIGNPTATSFSTTAAGDAGPIVSGGLGPAGGITNVRDIDRSNVITAAGDRGAATSNIGAIVRIDIGPGGPFAPSGAEQELAVEAPGGDAGISSAVAVAGNASTTVSRATQSPVWPRLDRVAMAGSIDTRAQFFAQWSDSGRDVELAVGDELEELLSALAAGRRPA